MNLNCITTNWKTLLSLKLFLFIFSFFFGCKEEKQNENVIAKVNNETLTEEELAAAADSSFNFYREEFIRNWINSQLLYQEAVDEGILNDEAFNSSIEEAKKNLAVSLLLQKKYKDFNVPEADSDLEEYFNSKKDEFIISEAAYLLNKIEFNDEAKAVQFRNLVFQDDWKTALTIFSGDSSILNHKEKFLQYEYEIKPGEFSRLVREMYPGETSIILISPKESFLLFHLNEKYEKGTIPSYEAIKDEVRKSYRAEKKKEFIEQYINELYSNNDIEVKNK